MPIDYNQLLKVLDSKSICVKILICFIACALQLYPILFSFTSFFRNLSIYEQLFFILGGSAIYIGIGIPLSSISGIKYPGMFYLPISLLAISAGICFLTPQIHRTSVPAMELLCILLPLVYGVTILIGVTRILFYEKKQESSAGPNKQ